jgi:hypothetical protein
MAGRAILKIKVICSSIFKVEEETSVKANGRQSHPEDKGDMFLHLQGRRINQERNQPESKWQAEPP